MIAFTMHNLKTVCMIHFIELTQFTFENPVLGAKGLKLKCIFGEERFAGGLGVVHARD